MARRPSNDDSDVIRQTVADLAYDSISQRIASGEYGASERITEARIVDEFKVSRGAAREAISRLAADGLVQLEIYKGAVVRAISRKDMADFLEVRAIFESFAAQRSGERINEEGSREAVHAALEQCSAVISAPSSDKMVDNDTLFHSVIMELSGNSILSAEWRRLRRSRFRIRFIQSLTPEEIVESIEMIRSVLLAILDGDGERAGMLAQKHLRLMNSRIQRLSAATFDEIFNPPGTKPSKEAAAPEKKPKKVAAKTVP